MKLIIGADLVPTKTNENLFLQADTDTLFGEELKQLLAQADYRIFNLEEPLTDSDAPIAKCGPCLKAPPETVNGIRAMGVNLFTMANNHITDYGPDGLQSTRRVLEENGICYTGVGANAEEASKPFFLEKDGKRIGIVACVEHEFSVATDERAGAYGFDPLETPDLVAKCKAECDYVIVLYHGGKEFYRYPSPNLQKTCRKLAEKGADLILTQHCHCIGCYEEYYGSTILYGQGNFLFDDGDDEYVNTGLLVEVDDDFQVRFVPICRQDNTVRLAAEERKEEILAGLRARSEEILREGFVRARYDRFAAERLAHYLFWFGAKKRTFFSRVMNRLTGQRWTSYWLNRKYKKQTLLTIWNYVECEAHRELLLRGIEIKNGK